MICQTVSAHSKNDIHTSTVPKTVTNRFKIFKMVERWAFLNKLTHCIRAKKRKIKPNVVDLISSLSSLLVSFCVRVDLAWFVDLLLESCVMSLVTAPCQSVYSRSSCSLLSSAETLTLFSSPPVSVPLYSQISIHIIGCVLLGADAWLLMVCVWLSS